MMCLQVLIFLTWSIVFASGTAVDDFEYVGGGYCAPTTDCGSMSCVSSSFYRYTDSAYQSTNLETCAADALQAGAQGFYVGYNGCRLVPLQDPGLSDSAECPSTSTTSCPAPSPYGSIIPEYLDYYYESMGYESMGDWEWLEFAGVSPILGVHPSSSFSCYRLKESPTEVPTENPVEVPTENPTEDVNACDAYPCQNGGTCTDAAGGASDASGRSCTCSDGFTGDNCETEAEAEAEAEEVDACLAHPCQNDGACTDVAGGGSDASGRTCACTRGFTGDNCETASTLALRCDDHNDKITCTGVDKCQWRRDTTTRTKSCFLKECRAFRNHRKCTSSDVGKELGCEFKGKRCQAPGEESECDAGNKRDCRAMDHCEWLRKDCRVKVVLTPGCGQYDTNASCKRRDNWPSDMNADIVCEWGNGVCTETEEVGCPAFKTQYECLRPLGVLLRCKWSRNRNNRGCRRQ